MGGAFGAALIPVFSKNQEQAKKLLYQALLLFGALSCILSFFFFCHSDVLVSLLTAWDGEKAQSASRAFGYVVILIPLTVMAGGTTAVLALQGQIRTTLLGHTDNQHLNHSWFIFGVPWGGRNSTSCDVRYCRWRGEISNPIVCIKTDDKHISMASRKLLF